MEDSLRQVRVPIEESLQEALQKRFDEIDAQTVPDPVPDPVAEEPLLSQEDAAWLDEQIARDFPVHYTQGEADETAENVAIPPRFAIDSMQRAEWLLNKLANIASSKTRVSTHSKQIIEGLDYEDNTLRTRFMPELEHFIEEQLANAGWKKRSLVTLHGTCGFREIAMSVKIAPDQTEDAVHYALQVFPEMVTEVPQLDRDAYVARAKEELTKNGEVLPGITVNPRHVSFSVSFTARAKPKGRSTGAATAEEGEE